MADALLSSANRAGIPTSSLNSSVVDGVEGFAAKLEGRVHFVITDLPLEATRRVNVALAELELGSGTPWLRRLMPVQDSLHPGEPGFLRQFALPKTVAVHTLRHGADLPFVEDTVV